MTEKAEGSRKARAANDHGASSGSTRRIAVPVAAGRLAAHFGHCEEFVILSPKEGSDSHSREAEVVDALEAPPHKPGLLPAWLSERGVNVVIAGGMGNRAQRLFCDAGIEVVVGAAGGDPKEIAQSYLDGTLVTGPNACDH
jgi:ATP-binding protein involved in chromosome partitioning